MLQQTPIILLVNGFVNSQHLKLQVPAPEDFDINTNSSLIFALSYAVKVTYEYLSVDGSNVPVAMFAAAYVDICWFDSLTPYYPKV